MVMLLTKHRLAAPVINYSGFGVKLFTHLRCGSQFLASIMPANFSVLVEHVLEKEISSKFTTVPPPGANHLQDFRHTGVPFLARHNSSEKTEKFPKKPTARGAAGPLNSSD
jgi:hypothetical protein